MANTRVKDLMTAQPAFISSDATLQEAAKRMKAIDCGVLPVGSKEKLEGIITDRDIVIRAMSEGRDPAQAKVHQCMSDRVYRCHEENTLQEAADIMAQHGIGRLLVDNDAGVVTGILSFGCILRKHRDAGEISRVVAHAVKGKAA